MQFRAWLILMAAPLRSPTNPLAPHSLEEAETAAQKLGMQLITLDAGSAGQLSAALRALSRSAGDALFLTGELLFLANKAEIAQAVRKARLPAMFPYREYHDEKVLMSYGANLTDVGRKMAAYVDKILRGAKTADLPIEQMSKYEFVINLREARAQGVHVPRELLLRADEVIR